MKRSLIFPTIIAAYVGVGLAACETCEDKMVAALLSPAQQTDADGPSSVTYRQLQAGISCLDSRLFEIADNWLPRDVLTDYRFETGNSESGGYMAAGLVIRSAAAYAGLRELGCLDALPPLPEIDWTAQTLVITHVQSNEGCLDASEVSLGQAQDGIARVQVSVHYTPEAGCHFEDARAFIVDQPRARAHLRVTAGCGSSKDTPDV